ncbi:DUF3024 domain-containing protein [Vibrio methylphosphonaticus]|uniref:DUF3024 domain-containing protein n=1 Tax=Vibrio methylphosphonaticus TaxID=2946866 RepID=UPI002029F0A2|nr:DUF3024 domain-containing protein [Vibrio methylphosphonaticus]MCL9776621.1 DUF3024 domain-containing protein [Vibrio methylphosphonaticus]
MTLIQMSQCRLERCAEMVCMNRNKSIPVELGKSLFETIPNGVLFSNAHYLLDSTFSDYTNSVAKVEFDSFEKSWHLSIPSEDDESQWIPYPFLSQSRDLTAIMREIEKDPKAYFW